jgi:hypothetical protein
MIPENENELCKKFKGTHFRNQQYISESMNFTWDGIWAVIDTDGILLGYTIGADDTSQKYANVDDAAMVTLPAGEKPDENGYYRGVIPKAKK